MPKSLAGCLVVGISSRALFDLSYENAIFEKAGLEAYTDYQREHEHDVLKPGTGFPLVRSLLTLNDLEPKRKRVEVVILSHNSVETGLRIFHSIAHYQLDISRAAFCGDHDLFPYLRAFSIDLFLSAEESDVQEAIRHHYATGLIYPSVSNEYEALPIRIAFDGDAVLFSDEAEQIYQKEGLDAFVHHEVENAAKPLPQGPFAHFLQAIAQLQEEFKGREAPIITALVTARNAPAHERVVSTFRAWHVTVDQSFFLGGLSKQPILAAFRPHIFFDDQQVHGEAASAFVPSARVAYPKRES